MASKYRKKFDMPEGYYQLLENYCREVLRDQPLDVVEYSWMFFKALEDGKIEEFDYPKKGKNLPPPPRIISEEEAEMMEQEQYRQEEEPRIEDEQYYNEQAMKD